MPRVGRRPTEYLTQIRFVPRRHDFPTDPGQLDTMVKLSRQGECLLYGSNFPMWDLLDLEDDGWPPAEALGGGYFGDNALATYPRLRSGSLPG
jgi:hypothetical protein